MAELAAERVALQEEKGEESSDDEFLMPGERRLKNRFKFEVPRQSWQMEVLEAIDWATWSGCAWPSGGPART